MYVSSSRFDVGSERLAASRFFSVGRDAEEEPIMPPADMATLGHLQDGPKSADELASLCGVDRRQIHKRISHLRRYNYTVQLMPTGLYFVSGPRERVCAYAGCSTKLSRYNPGIYCGPCHKKM